MKKSNLILAMLAVVLASCNSSSTLSKNAETYPTDNATAGKSENLIRFKVNGQSVETTGWTISRFTLASDPKHEWLNVTTNMKADKRTINMNIAGTTPGTYAIGGKGTHGSHGAYYPDYLGDLGRSFSFASGNFTITSIDTVKHLVNAKFSGTVKSLKGESFEVKDGEILNGVLNLSVIPY